ncbi:MAG TPA: hypothetical protein PK109_02205 [Candidatus Paceibacterota bacterium]|nr:hypothetical protein [Candidatus Paceibacterota bacterium]
MAETDLMKIGFKKLPHLSLNYGARMKGDEKQIQLTAYDEDDNALPAVTFFRDQLPFYAIFDEETKKITIVVMSEKNVLYKKAIVYASKHGIPRRLHHHKV